MARLCEPTKLPKHRFNPSTAWSPSQGPVWVIAFCLKSTSQFLLSLDSSPLSSPSALFQAGAAVHLPGAVFQLWCRGWVRHGQAVPGPWAAQVAPFLPQQQLLLFLSQGCHLCLRSVTGALPIPPREMDEIYLFLFLASNPLKNTAWKEPCALS